MTREQSFMLYLKRLATGRRIIEKYRVFPEKVDGNAIVCLDYGQERDAIFITSHLSAQEPLKSMLRQCKIPYEIEEHYYGVESRLTFTAYGQPFFAVVRERI